MFFLVGSLPPWQDCLIFFFLIPFQLQEQWSVFMAVRRGHIKYLKVSIGSQLPLPYHSICIYQLNIVADIFGVVGWLKIKTHCKVTIHAGNQTEPCDRFLEMMSWLDTVICYYFAQTNNWIFVESWSIKRNQKHTHMPAPIGYAHVYWFNTGLSFILSGSVSYPPEYTITTLLLHEWTSVRLTAGLVPFSGLIPFQPPANVSMRTRSAEQIAEAAFKKVV